MNYKTPKMSVLDEQTRSLALSLNKSFIVQAPAGSGKTSLLVKRFINLLNSSKFPEECLAITFTKKAALEMQDRVLLTLEELTKSTHFPKDHIYLRVLENPNKLQILTIDAFSLNLIKKMPLLSKCWINFSISEDPKHLYREAVIQLLSELEDDNQDPIEINYFIKLLEYFSNDYELIIGLLVDLLSKREQWLPLIVPMIVPIKLNEDLINSVDYKNHTTDTTKTVDYTNHTADSRKTVDYTNHTASSINYLDYKNINYVEIRNFLENNLKHAIEDILIELFQNLPAKAKQNDILDLAKYAANNLDDLNNYIIHCRNLQDIWPEPVYENLPIWKGLRELLLTKDGKPRTRLSVMQGFITSKSKYKMQQLLEDLKIHEQVFLTKLQKINILPEEHKYEEENWQLIASLIKLLPKLVAHLMLVFKEHHIVDFTQISMAAIEAISDDEHLTDLSLAMEYNLKHILIDEFQDTSNLHFNLLEKLIATWMPNDGRTIFIVGDPMQSIYRFRQANVSLFLQVQQSGIANLKPTNLSLTTNFRSSLNLIEQFNNLFSKIFPLSDDTIYGGVKYNLATYHNTLKSECTLESNKINYAINQKFDFDNLTTDDKDCDRDRNKNFDKDFDFFLIDNVLDEADYISNLIKKIKNFNKDLSVAILLRTKMQANIIIKQLKQHNISYQSNELDFFINQEVITDLLTLTKAILHINDKIAWLALLRGPLIGIKLQDLNILFESNDNIPFFEQLHLYQNKPISEEAMIRLEYVLPILITAVNDIQLYGLSISTHIKRTWLKLGGNLIVKQEQLELVELFFYKLANIDDPLSINAIDRLIEDQFIQSNNTIDLNAVQLMTIHKSKGLEFDVVILPGMDKASKNFQHQLLLWELRNKFLSTKQPNNGKKKQHNNYKNKQHNLNKCIQNYLLFAPMKSLQQTKNSIYDFIKSSEEERDLHEIKRLLYVAFTRAKKKFFGFVHKNNQVNHKSFFKLLEPYINLNIIHNSKYNNEILIDKVINNVSEDENLQPIILCRLPNSWYIEKLKVKSF